MGFGMQPFKMYRDSELIGAVNCAKLLLSSCSSTHKKKRFQTCSNLSLIKPCLDLKFWSMATLSSLISSFRIGASNVVIIKHLEYSHNGSQSVQNAALIISPIYTKVFTDLLNWFMIHASPNPIPYSQVCPWAQNTKNLIIRIVGCL